MYKKLISIILAVLPITMYSQYNTDRLIMTGRSALYYEDYVLSIQYFNQAISAKPYLYEPWYYRGVAKFYLDDFVGSENDCSKAIDLNPFVYGIYELRALCRIHIKDYDGAINDYGVSIKNDPDNQGLWYNRVLCRMQQRNYTGALHDLDSMTMHWNNYAKAYSLRADVYLAQKDTLKAAEELDKSLKLDPYDGEVWTQRAMISLSRKRWKESDTFLSKAIHLKPSIVNNYVNRALARYNISNLRGAMSDYDRAIDLDPNNFLAHYNRALLRTQVGDDNRAILDFTFVLNLEPDNLMAIFNRALLLDRTGNLRAAIEDYSKVIRQFPNFWTGLQYRANCYRRLGYTKQAELDEFRIFKAQLNKTYGIQPRWKAGYARHIRKKSDRDMSKYNELVVADDENVEHEYSSEYRGKVQDHKIIIEYQPMYQMSYLKYNNGVKSYDAFDKGVDQLNRKIKPSRNIYVTCNPKTLNEDESKEYFAIIDSLTKTTNLSSVGLADNDQNMLIQRAVAYSVIQNYDDALADLNAYIKLDSTSYIAYWQRAICKVMVNEFKASQGIATQLKAVNIINDFNDAIHLNNQDPYLYYNRANFYAQCKQYNKALDDYNEAIKLDKNLAEAYFNKGLVEIYSNNLKAGIQNLSKAGELGIYSAYSVIKKYSK